MASTQVRWCSVRVLFLSNDFLHFQSCLTENMALLSGRHKCRSLRTSVLKPLKKRDLNNIHLQHIVQLWAVQSQKFVLSTRMKVMEVFARIIKCPTITIALDKMLVFHGIVLFRYFIYKSHLQF